MSSCFVLGGCAVNAPARAQEKAAAFQRLSPADQQLVLNGRVHKGMSADAVYIAWGPPSEVKAPGLEQGPLEGWHYINTEYGDYGGFFGARRGLVYSPKAGRYLYDSNDFYETPIFVRGLPPPQTDVDNRNALFDHGKLVAFEELRQHHDDN